MIQINPLDLVDEKTIPVRMGWPPPGLDERLLVSPEEQGKPIYDAWAAKRDADNIPTLRLDWPEPFDLLFPTGGGWDLLYGQRLMRQCVEFWQSGQKEQVIQKSEHWVSKLIGEGHGPLGKAWFWPKALANPEGALLEVYTRFGLDVASVEEVLASESLQAELSKHIPVRRVCGWLGYFWWEFYQDVKTRTFVGYCNHCGNIIRGGHRDRRHCTKEESPDCFRERAKIRKRISRS